MSQPYVVVIILNTNRCQDTMECLASLIRGTYKNYKVMVLDNGSTDGSVEAVQRTYPQVEIIELSENRGYAGNNNVGIEAALKQGADWIFILNEDTVLNPDCLSRLIEVGESDPKIGIVGPMVFHYDEPTVIQSAGGMLGPFWESYHIAKDQPDQEQICEPHPVEWISGCAILLRSEVIKQAGLIDERLFIYWEETEWCMRAKKNNWTIMHIPDSKIWHKGYKIDYHPKPSFTYYMTRNRLFVLEKHHAPLLVWIFACVQISRTMVSWTINPRWRSMHEHRNSMWRGVMDFLRHQWGPMPVTKK